MFVKPVRQVDEDFLEFLRSEACVTCGAPPRSDPSHLKTRGSGGSDYTACSQCRRCHEKWHSLGPLSAPKFFFETYGVNIWQAQSKQLATYFSDPAVILKKAAEIFREEGALGDQFRNAVLSDIARNGPIGQAIRREVALS